MPAQPFRTLGRENGQNLVGIDSQDANGNTLSTQTFFVPDAKLPNLKTGQYTIAKVSKALEKVTTKASHTFTPTA